jgi:flagellar basal-body rod protein FlgB
MSISNLPLMRAMNAKMDYLDKRQMILSQNIANADTPDYQSRDLSKVDFGAVLKNVTDSNKVRIETTNPRHMPGLDAVKNAKDNKDKLSYEVAPDKNGVVLEEQMVKANETQMDYSLITNLMSKQSAMFRIALGRQT